MSKPSTTAQLLFLRAWLPPTLAAGVGCAVVGGLAFGAGQLLAAPAWPGSGGLWVLLGAAVPAIASLALPLAATLGTVAVARRWQAEGEWVALQAAGVRARDLGLPNLGIALVVGGLCALLAHEVEPAARARAAEAVARGVTLRPDRALVVGPFTLAAARVEGEAFEDVFFALERPGGPAVGSAVRGTLRSGTLILYDGVLQDPDSTVRARFRALSVPTPRPNRRWELRERSDERLRDLVARMEAHHRPAHYERAVLLKRTAWPVAAGLLALLALPLGLRGSGPPALVLIGYWVLVRVCDQAGGALGAVASAWLPTLALGALLIPAWLRRP